MNSWRFVLLVLGALLLLNTTKVHAQENWQLGIEITPSYYMLLNNSDKNAFYYSTKQPELFDIKGFTGGIRMSVDFGEYLGIMTGIRYSYGRQDYAPNVNWLVSDFNQYTVQNYLQIPLMLTLGTNNGYNSRFYGSVGVSLGYLLNYVERVDFINDVNQEFTLNEYRNQEYTSISYSSNYQRLILRSDNQYETIQVNGLLELGYKWNFDNGLVFNLGVQSQIGITNPENRDAELYDIPDGFSPHVLWNNNLGEKWYNVYDEIVERAPTRVLHVGILIGLYYQFGYY
jgi:hypothetical protein